MQMTLRIAAVAALLVAASAVQLRSGGEEQFFSYDYAQHGADWTAGSCSSRSRQSPVDLPAAAAVTGTFNYKYKPIDRPFDLMNNGHAYAADFAGLGYGGLTYDGAWYELMNINVHAKSEHAWAGVRKPIELHLVHKHYASEKLLIVAIAVESAKGMPVSFAQYNTSANLRASGKQAPQYAEYAVNYAEPPTGDADFNKVLQAFLIREPPAVNMKVSVPANADNTFDLNDLLQASTFYEYAGSLTAPPCAEIATWLVRKEALKASDKQVLYLHDAVFKTTADFGNYRALMPLNGRQITMRRGLLEDPPRSKQEVKPAPGGPQESDREFRAMKWSMDAMTIAKGATDYIKDLDSRLRNAAQAHAEALAPRLEPLDAPGAPGATGAIGKKQTGPPGKPPATIGTDGMPAPPIQMEDAAQQMAHTLADAARAEVEDATQQITKKAKEAAIVAAKEAATMVASGQGDPMAMANAAHGVPAAAAR